MPTDLSITDIGPVEHFEGQLHPGLSVLYGAPGSGKTTILRTIEVVANGETAVKLTKRDGTKSGTAEIAGRTLRISKRQTEDGDLSVEGLGELDLSVLAWPRFDKPETRDQHRIKALIRLAGVSLSLANFRDLLPEDERQHIVAGQVPDLPDPIELAGKIKRAIEREAQMAEKLADVAMNKAMAQKPAYADIDLEDESDDGKLRAAWDAARAAQIELGERAKSAAYADGLIAQANESLAISVAAFSGHLSVEQAENSIDHAKRRLIEIDSEIERLLNQVQAAKDRKATCQSLLKVAESDLDAATRHVESVANWQKQIDTPRVTAPTPDEIAAAAKQADFAKAMYDRGAVIRAGLAAKRQHDEQAEAALKARKLAGRLRDAAKGTQDVLGRAIATIPGCPLRVVDDPDGNSRLVMATDRSDAEPFDELSDGERWVQILGMRRKPNRLLTLSQSAFGELPDSAREAIDDAARDVGAFVVTAQVDGGTLRLEAYSGAAVRRPIR